MPFTTMAASRPANDGRRVEGTTLLGAEQISKSTSGRSPGLRLIAPPMPSRRPNFLRKAVAKSSTGSPLTVAQPRRIRTAFPIKPGWVSWRPMSRFRMLSQRSDRCRQCSGAAARCQRAARRAAGFTNRLFGRIKVSRFRPGANNFRPCQQMQRQTQSSRRRITHACLLHTLPFSPAPHRRRVIAGGFAGVPGIPGTPRPLPVANRIR